MFRRIILLNAAVIQNRDLVGDGHCLFLIVRDDDGGDARLLLHAADFVADFDLEARVEVAHRFVEQQHVRLLDQRARHGNALLLAAGKLGRLAVEQILDLQHLGNLARLFITLGLLHALLLEREGDVVDDLQMRIQRVGLEHHADVAVFRLELRHILIAEKDFAGSRLQQAGNAVERRRLAAAGRAEQRDEGGILKDEIDVVQRDGLRVVFLAEIFNANHMPLPPEKPPFISDF